MKSIAILILFCLGLVAARTPHAAKYNKLQNERRQQAYQEHARASSVLQKRFTPQYLTNLTSKFAVDASALPDVTPDVAAAIPESYAGLLPVGNSTEDELFFWFVPTTNPDASDEILIWLNGGPGCSSLDGFWHENGPITWYSGTYKPVINTWAWSNLTNVVWIEQPVGTGYSQGTPTAQNEEDVAVQFNLFWKNFVDTFGLQNREVYVTGESYAGQYVPYISAAMLEHNDTVYYNVSGVLIYDPSIGYDSITEQAPAVSLVDYNQNVFPFNDSFVAEIHNISASCGYDSYLEQAFTFPPAGPLPPPPGTNARGRTTAQCDVFDRIFEAIFEINPCFDIYQVGQLCPLLFDTLGFPYSDFYLPAGYDQPYFNLTAVKEVLHAPNDVNWEICTDIDVFPNGDSSLPSGLTGGPLQYVTERTNNVIVGHGQLDMVLIANGSLATLQNLTWNGQQGFSSPPTNPFYVPYHDDPQIASQAGAGVFGSWVTERGLTYVEIDLAGHMVPEFQPSAAYRHLEVLLGRVGDLSEVSPFTTQPNYIQPSDPLGLGNAPIQKPIQKPKGRVPMVRRNIPTSESGGMYQT